MEERKGELSERMTHWHEYRCVSASSDSLNWNGTGTAAGTVQYYVVASDSLGNQSTSYTGSEDFMCGGTTM